MTQHYVMSGPMQSAPKRPAYQIQNTEGKYLKTIHAIPGAVGVHMDFCTTDKPGQGLRFCTLGAARKVVSLLHIHFGVVNWSVIERHEGNEA